MVVIHSVVKVCLVTKRHHQYCTAVYEAVFSPKVLDIKTEDLLKRFTEGVTKVAAVSLQISYPTLASVPHCIIEL